MVACLIVLALPAPARARNSDLDVRQDESVQVLDRLIEQGGVYPGTLVSNVLPSMFEHLGGRWERPIRKTWSTRG